MNLAKAKAQVAAYMNPFKGVDLSPKLLEIIESAYASGQTDGYKLCLDEFEELTKRVEDEKDS